MKKTVYVCDKCRKEVAEENVIRDHDFDFCEACAKKLDDLITDWVMKVEKKPKQKKEKVEKTLKKTEKPLKTQKPERIGFIDWDKACALKIAGWSHRDIADEVKTTEGTISAMIYEKMKIYQKGGRENGESRNTETNQ